VLVVYGSIANDESASNNRILFQTLVTNFRFKPTSANQV
jgi:hypothetical protein